MKRIIILILALFLLTATAYAQDADPGDTAPAATIEAVASEAAPVEVTPEAVVIPEVPTNEALKEALEIGAQMGEASGIFKGAGIGALLTMAMGGLFLTLMVRSTVVQTIIEGLIFSRLDPDSIARIRGTSKIFRGAADFVDKVTDGLPNEKQTTAG